MKKMLVVLCAVVLSVILTAAESVPEKFFMLKVGNTAGAELAETEPGKITLKMVSGAKALGNYVVICHNRNTVVKPGTTLSYKITPVENYADGTHFTPAVSFIKQGEKQWIGNTAKGHWLHKGATLSFDLIKDFKVPENSNLRQIKFVLNAGKSPQGKEIKVVISDLKLTTPDVQK